MRFIDTLLLHEFYTFIIIKRTYSFLLIEIDFISIFIKKH